MIEVHQGAQFDRDEYLAGLCACFPGWGGPKEFSWNFSRSPGVAPADLFTMHVGGERVAGSAVSYRELVLHNGSRIDVGIMTGSWTLPAARGQGCFQRAIVESVKLTAARQAGLLLAFVTENNPSRRRLEAGGAALFPTTYLRSTENTPLLTCEGGLEEVGDVSSAVTSFREALSSQRASSTRMDFKEADDWRSQFLERPNPSVFLASDADTLLIIEEAPDTDRLLLASAPNPAALHRAYDLSLQRAQRRGKKFFSFTTNEAIVRHLAGRGLEAIHGFITAQVADEDVLRQALGVADSWTAADSRCLADATGSWYLGPIDVQNGERT